MDADISTETENTPGDGSPAGKSASDEFVEIVKTIAYALGIAFVLRVLLFQPFTIPSGSMIPNLEIGDYIIVTKYSYGYSRHSIPLSPPIFKGRLFPMKPKRGDIVVFKDTKDNRTDYIKRLVGLPGDRIQVADGVVYLNDHALPQTPISPDPKADPFSTITQSYETNPSGRKYVIQDSWANGATDNTPVYLVPAGHYFFMGDNRDNSADSRVSTALGGVSYVPAENLVGKAQVILFSWEGAKIWNPITWFTKARPSRFFHGLK